MPRMDGLTFPEEIMAERPTPIIAAPRSPKAAHSDRKRSPPACEHHHQTEDRSQAFRNSANDIVANIKAAASPTPESRSRDRADRAPCSIGKKLSAD